MSQNETTRLVERPKISESPSAAMSKLSELARQAYEKKDKKECLDLTRAILLIDPQNADALWMRSSIQTDIRRDLDSSREFVRLAHSRESKEKPAPAGESAAASNETAEVPIQTESYPDQSADAELRRTPFARWLIAAAAMVALGAIVIVLPKLKNQQNPVAESPAEPAAAASKDKDAGEIAVPDVPIQQPPIAEVTNALPARASAVLPNVPPAVLSTTAPTRVSTPTPAVTPASAPRPEAASPDPPVVAAGRGTLAISSPTTVDIYRNDVYLGSVPVSLELTAGSQTLEYRHGSLRKTVTHSITSNETTKATITFDVSVPINSKPWAEVFVDGAERKDLGQTPLSGARVPIGSVLIFENPQFQPKRYRVTGNETGIQVVFP
jgi:hypothetical protein